MLDQGVEPGVVGELDEVNELVDHQVFVISRGQPGTRGIRRADEVVALNQDECLAREIHAGGSGRPSFFLIGRSAGMDGDARPAALGWSEQWQGVGFDRGRGGIGDLGQPQQVVRAELDIGVDPEKPGVPDLATLLVGLGDENRLLWNDLPRQRICRRDGDQQEEKHAHGRGLA